MKRQIGLERTPAEFIDQMVEVFRLVREVLSDDGTLWLNLGDSYAHSTDRMPPHRGEQAARSGKQYHTDIPTVQRIHGLKPKDLFGMPWRVAFALQADGWYLRSDIIWHKPNPMPESVTDRPTKAHEYLFLLTKNPRYFYDAAAVREESSSYGRQNSFRSERKSALGKEWQSPPGDRYDVSGRNRRTVWTIATAPFAKAHFATFPPKLVEPCILAGTSEKGHCPDCGARWVRETEQARGFTNGKCNACGMPEAKHIPGPGSVMSMTPAKAKHLTASMRGAAGSKTANASGAVPCGNKLTTGWQPTCECGRKPVPDVVLDPFAGSGTTGMVAEQLGREFLGIELNAKYSKLAREAA